MVAISFFSFAFLIGSTRALIKPRIVGGENANIKDFPHQASLRIKGEHFCGAVIIDNTHVLSAAHCFITEPAQNNRIQLHPDVRVNTGTSYNYKETGDRHRVAKLTIHPDWKGMGDSSFVNDIAVLTLLDPIIFDDRQQKVDLPSHDVVSGMKAYLSGWGCTSLEAKTKNSDNLQKLEMTILTYSDCQSKLPSKIYENQLCAYHNKGHGACLGDSGGPLIIDNQVVGLVSWVHQGKAASGIPEVYTNVYAHKNFIESAL